MIKAKAKTIKLLLYEGDLSGVVKLEDASWTNSGVLYSSPRKSVNMLIESEACKRVGVYMLLSSSKVYIGQSKDLARRISEHVQKKDWWTNVIVLTSSSDKLNAAGIDYLESELIKRAYSLRCLDCENKTKGNAISIGEFEKIELEQYLEEAFFYLELIGVSIFSERKNTNLLIDTMDIRSRLSFGKRSKNEAIQFLRDSGISLPLNSSSITYAVKRNNFDEFFANPNISLLKKDWTIILNDTDSKTLRLLLIPPNTLHVKNDLGIGLHVRTDKQDKIDLHLDLTTLVDKKSNVDFSVFEEDSFQY